MWEMFKEWFLSLGESYGVNPFIFGGIYVGAIPFFSLSIAWLIRNVRPNRCSVTIRDGLIQDGNHRFAAALYRGDDLVSCCLME